jgi:hypothetical protein
MYEFSSMQQQVQQGDAGQFVTSPQDVAVTLYASSQPASYVYQQTSTMAYRQLYQTSDGLSSYCTPMSSAPPPSAVFIQDAGSGHVSSLPPPTHYMVPSVASSIGAQTFTAAAGIAPQFSFAQPIASASFDLQRPPSLYQQAATYTGFSAAAVRPPESFSVFSAVQHSQPPPPTNSNAVSYWMTLS